MDQSSSIKFQVFFLFSLNSNTLLPLQGLGRFYSTSRSNTEVANWGGKAGTISVEDSERCHVKASRFQNDFSVVPSPFGCKTFINYQEIKLA